MMLSVAFRAPILALASLVLVQNGGVVMAAGGYDTGAVRTAITSTTTPSPATATTTADIIFYHDTIPTGGTYSKKFYYAGCINELPSPPSPTPTPSPDPLGAIRSVNGVTVDGVVAAVAGPDTTAFVNTCGTNNDAACTSKTTYAFNLERLNGITDSFIKSTSTVNGVTTTTIKFCVRHSLNAAGAAGPAEVGYRAADVTVSWNSDSSFQGGVVTTENGADNSGVNVGNVGVSVVRCSNVVGGLPDNYEQGELIQLCVSPTVTVPGVTVPGVAVTIVKVNDLRFWIDNPLDGNVNGVYNPGETTQVGMANGLPVGTTTILPALAGAPPPTTSPATAPVYCTQAFGGTAAGGFGVIGTGCVLSTLLAPAFFVPATGFTTTVQYAGTVTIEFGDGNNRRRRVLSLRGDHHHRSVQQLKVGDQFDKPFVASVTTTSADERNNSTCSCSGFFLFKIICWIFKCLLGFD